jgi:hypothetical protein
MPPNSRESVLIFLRASYRTATDRLSFKKIPQNQLKTPFYIRSLGVLNANLSNSAKRTLS